MGSWVVLTIRLFEQWCCEHWRANICPSPCFHVFSSRTERRDPTLNFLRSSPPVFPRSSCTVLVPTSNAPGFCYFPLKKKYPSYSVKCCLIVVLVCLSPARRDAKHLFALLIGHISLEECLVIYVLWMLTRYKSLKTFFSFHFLFQNIRGHLSFYWKYTKGFWRTC